MHFIYTMRNEFDFYAVEQITSRIKAVLYTVVYTTVCVMVDSILEI